MPSIKAVIFDCDGTLVDSEILGNEVLVEYLAEYGLRLDAEQATTAFRGRKMAECVAQLNVLLPRPLPDSFVPEFRRRTAAAFRCRLQAIEGAADLLRALAIPFCVASNGPREKIELGLAVTGLLPLVKDQILSSYEVGIWKPEPGLFLRAANMMNVPPEQCAVVEDSLPGIHAALAAGMTAFAFLADERDEPIPDRVHVVRHLRELHNVLVRPARVLA